MNVVACAASVAIRAHAASTGRHAACGMVAVSVVLAIMASATSATAPVVVCVAIAASAKIYAAAI